MSLSVSKAKQNVLPEPVLPSWFSLIVRQLKSPLVYILIVAACLSLVVGDFFDAGVIAFAVFLNTVLGYFQESKASNALQELRRFVQPETRVRRDGVVMMIDARDVRVGDQMILETGDRVSADAHLTLAHDLQVNESTLSGESMPVEKDVHDASAVYMGTTIVAGRGEATVVAIGTDTRLGEVAELVATLEDEQTPLQQQLGSLARVLSLVVLVVGLGILLIGLFKGENLLEMLTLSAALAVAAIPEGLLVGVTVILAIGMQRILKQKALVRHLLAAETLGSVSVICTDKTGTITQGDMRLTEVRASHKESAHLVAVLCNNALMDGSEVHGSITEAALLLGVARLGCPIDALMARHPRLDEIPFSSSSKYMATLHRFGKKNVILVKGAPEVVAEFCSAGVSLLEDDTGEMTRKGLRVIATAMKEVSESVKRLSPDDLMDLRCVGTFGLSDPLREEAVQTIAEAKRAGIRTVIITGDHRSTAMSIAEQVGFVLKKDRVLTGEELEVMSEKDFEKRLSSIDLYVRVLPSHKVRIVQAWKRSGASVAMVGDGVNDAPALKAADIGVALGSGTEVAKQTSDMVLLDNNLATLVRAVREGRIIFENIRKVVVYLLTDCFSEMTLIVGSFIIGLPIPLLPAQILWINLVTDGFPHLALTIEPEEPGIMDNPPRLRSEPVLDPDTKKLIFLIGVITDIALLGIYVCLIRFGYDLAFARTFIFAALGTNSLFYVFSIRSLRTSIFHGNPFKNRALNVAVFIGFLFLAAPLVIPPIRDLFGFVQLGFVEIVLLVVIGFVKMLFVEAVKLFIKWKKHNRGR